ncbi:MAG: hypothetical protein BWY85_02354 [Firmicutes bacterium ADurb.Bin506]|nr:MAG: hypothetical protein BWY85_02354 [Firmicutes bacterium ADurb.Bin506]
MGHVLANLTLTRTSPDPMNCPAHVSSSGAPPIDGALSPAVTPAMTSPEAACLSTLSITSSSLSSSSVMSAPLSCAVAISRFSILSMSRHSNIRSMRTGVTFICDLRTRSRTLSIECVSLAILSCPSVADDPLSVCAARKICAITSGSSLRCSRSSSPSSRYCSCSSASTRNTFMSSSVMPGN